MYLLVHRVVWFIVTENDPKDSVIDHKDGIKTNNLIDNLRCVSHSFNVRNSTAKSAIYPGVIFRNGRYEVSIFNNNKRTYLGIYSSESKAVEVRKEAEKQLALQIGDTALYERATTR
jgi:hypothetical protein